MRAGDAVDVAPPTGFFQLTADDGDLVTFAAGSGVTPIFSLIKTALATTTRRIRLLYANRDRASIIFEHELAALAAAHPDRLTVVHHFDVDDGFVSAATAAALLDGAEQPTAYVCGPTPFMDIVEHALLERGVAAGQIHIERFTPGGPAIEPLDEPVPVAVSVGTHHDRGSTAGPRPADHHPGTTILQTARSMVMSPPFSCEAGSCATCMARLEEGEAKMHVNNAAQPRRGRRWVGAHLPGRTDVGDRARRVRLRLTHRPTEDRGIHPMELDEFRTKLDAWLDEHEAALAPAHEGLGTLDEQMAHLSKVKRLVFDAGWMRWGWPERVGGLGGSSLLRAYLGEALTARDIVEPGVYSLTEFLLPTMIDFAAPELAMPAMRPRQAPRRRDDGARASPGRSTAPATSRRWRAAPCAPTTGGTSPARRCGPATPSTRSGACS